MGKCFHAGRLLDRLARLWQKSHGLEWPGQRLQEQPELCPSPREEADCEVGFCPKDKRNLAGLRKSTQVSAVTSTFLPLDACIVM